MSRASTERDATMITLCHAADRGVFTDGEMRRMFARMLQNMNVAEMNKMVADCTKFDDVDDVEFTLDIK
jgi:hypothetical protein